MKFEWNWGIKIVIAMIAFMLMVIAMVVFMTRQDFSLVERDYYPRGQAYQDMLEKKRNTVEYNNEIFIFQETDTIRISFPPIFRPGNIEGRVHFYHRISDNKDLHASLVLNDNGHFTYPVKGLKGRYIIKLEWDQDGISYYTEKTINIR